MPTSLLVTVLVGVGLASDPATLAMNEAMVEALGPGVIVRVQEASDPAGVAQSVARQSPQVAVVWVEWADSERHQVVLHVRRDRSSDWRERTLLFQDSDETRERGRTLGFVLASILRPEPALVDRAPRQPSLQPDTAGGRERRWAIEALATTSTGIGGTAGGMGAALALRRTLLPWLGTRLGLAARKGEVSSAGAASLSSRATLGASAHHLVGRHLSVGGRFDGALFYETVWRTSGGQSVRRGRFLPGAAAMVESAYSLTSAFEIVLTVGFDIAFGQTSIYVDDRMVTVLPMLRGVAELGLRVSF